MSIIYAFGPFQKGRIKLVEWVIVGNQKSLMPFEKEIYWATLSESTVEYTHGGKLIEVASTYNDYYGPGTSKVSAIADAKKAMKFYDITEESSLIVQVKTVVKNIPLLRTRKCEEEDQHDIGDNKWKHLFEPIPDSWRFADKKNEHGNVRLEAVEISASIVWTSKDAETTA